MPYMPPGAADQMKNMKPEDFARASEELGKSLRLQVECPWVQSNGGYSLLLHKVEGLTRATKISPPDVLECSTSVAHLLQAFEDDGRRRRACA